MASTSGAARHYLKRLPADQAEIPAGLVLVHNNVRPSRRQGNRGARYWVQAPADSLVVCDCGWAPELGAHYCVLRPWLHA